MVIENLLKSRSGRPILSVRGESHNIRQKRFCQDKLANGKCFVACLLTARRYNFVSVTRRSIRAPVQVPAPAGPENSHGARRVRRGFWRHGTDFKGLWRDRGTILIENSLSIPILLFV